MARPPPRFLVGRYALSLGMAAELGAAFRWHRKPAGAAQPHSERGRCPRTRGAGPWPAAAGYRARRRATALSELESGEVGVW